MRAWFKISPLLCVFVNFFVCSEVFAEEVKLQGGGKLRIGLVLDRGGIDDKSFNASAYEGAKKARDTLGAVLKYVESTDGNFVPLLTSFAQKKFDLVIAVGVSQVDALKKVASQFPQQQFAIVDGEVNVPNVKSILFQEHEGSFLVGAIAALKSKSGKIGFIGGMDIPLIRRFALGYQAGAKKAQPDIKVVTNYVGITEDSWNNPAKAKELAVSQYDSGVDVIFSASGASGSGLFDAAEEKKKYAIGVDSNQNWVKPKYILTSMVKCITQAVFDVCKEVSRGEFHAGIQRNGLADGGVYYAVDQFNQDLLSKSLIDQVEQFKADIISGKIQVPDYYKNKK